MEWIFLGFAMALMPPVGRWITFAGTFAYILLLIWAGQ